LFPLVFPRLGPRLAPGSPPPPMAALSFGKRAWQGVQSDAPAKAARGLEEDVDQWTCPKCGNLNYGSRLVCNMRKCGAPRTEEPWICPGCGNENYPTRIFCNMKRCQLARPGLTASAMKQHAQMEEQQSRRPVQQFQGAPQIVDKTQDPGCWTCGLCGNVNYPERTHCNSRKCGKPRTELPQKNFGYYGGVHQQGAASGKGSGKGAVAAKHPPGSWICASCQNVNYPQRGVCNGKNGTCGLAREDVDGGLIGAAATGANGEVPEGSWVCPTCSNVNWPSRTACNKRGCGQPKPNF